MAAERREEGAHICVRRLRRLERTCSHLNFGCEIRKLSSNLGHFILTTWAQKKMYLHPLGHHDRGRSPRAQRPGRPKSVEFSSETLFVVEILKWPSANFFRSCCTFIGASPRTRHGAILSRKNTYQTPPDTRHLAYATQTTRSKSQVRERSTRAATVMHRKSCG